MEVYECVSSDCTQLSEYSCTQQPWVALVSTTHSNNLFDSQASFGGPLITPSSKDEELEAVRLTYNCLAAATQQSVCQALRRINEGFCQATTLEELKAFTTESVQLRNELVAAMSLGWDMPNLPYFGSLGLARWVTENTQSVQLKTNFGQQVLQKPLKRSDISQSNRGRKPLPEIKPHTENCEDVDEAIRTFFKQVSIYPVRVSGKNLLNELQSVFRLIATRGVSIRAIGDALADRQVSIYEVYEYIMEELSNLGIKRIAATLDERSKAAVREQYRYWVATLALSTLETGTIDFLSQEYQSLTAQQVSNLLRWLPICTEETIERPATCHFLHSSLVDFVVAQQIVSDLESAEIGALTPTKLINRYNIVTKHGVRCFIVQAAKRRRKYFEHLLLDIVMQTRKRNDITQASANAMTLLNQMEYSFAHQNFRRVKVAGADLFEANLQGTNLEKTDLRYACLMNCTLTTTKLKQAALRGAKIDKMNFNGSLRTVAAVSFSPDGTLSASGGDDKTNIVWEAGKGQQITMPTGHSDWVRSIAFSPDGTLVVSAGHDTKIILWDARTGQEVRTIPVESGYIFSVCFSPNSALIASGGIDRRIIIWETETGRLVRTMTGHKTWVLSVCYSPDGALIVSASYDNEIIIWDATTDQQLRTLTGHRGEVMSVCFSPNGALIASGSWDNTVIVWETGTGQQLRTLTGHPLHVLSVCFSPDGTLVASAGQGTKILVWETGTGDQVCSLVGHFGEVNAVCFSPAGALIASASSDKTIIVWEVQTGQRVHTLKGHKDAVLSLCFSPDGALMASASRDKTIIMWDANILQLKGKML